VCDTLVGDADGVYHPALFGDRLLLGLMGIMSEAELHVLRARLTGGIRNKAARGELRRGLAAMVAPPVGRLVATDDAWEPYQLLDADGVVVEAVAAFLRDLQAAGRSPATLRSYGMDLLRWFRFLWAARVAWERTTRAEARDFSCWLQVAGNPARPHWRRQGESPTRSRAVPPAPTLAGTAYATSVRAHSETVLRGFYDFHRDAGSGPILNPFPLERSRRGQRAHAHHNPMEPHRNQRTGLYRPTVPQRIPRSIPDEQFNEIFARLPSHRDRALVAFYVSTGARASELLSTTRGGVDPDRQVITVVRKAAGSCRSCPPPPTRSYGCGSTSSSWRTRCRVGGGSRCGGRCAAQSAR
jgi:hypothetical protein